VGYVHGVFFGSVSAGTDTTTSIYVWVSCIHYQRHIEENCCSLVALYYCGARERCRMRMWCRWIILQLVDCAQQVSHNSTPNYALLETHYDMQGGIHKYFDDIFYGYAGVC